MEADSESSPEETSRPKRRRTAPAFLSVEVVNYKAPKKRTLTRASREKQVNIRKRASAVQQHRKERKRRDRLAAKKEEGAVVVCGEAEECFYEVEKILGKRKRKGRTEYLIKWKGCPESQNTWEPGSSLCDTAMAEAVRFTRRHKLKEKQRQEDERRLGLGGEENSGQATRMDGNAGDAKQEQVDDERKPSASEAVIVDEELQWTWTDEEQVIFREVTRINVNDDDARVRVTQARENGTPIVLVGHVGWADFAKRWLVNEESAPSETSSEGTTNEDTRDPLLDLSKPHKLDVSRMIEDIGEEDVPVLPKEYDEQNPTKYNIKVETYLEKCWPDTSNAAAAAPMNPAAPKLYLHQWQFPLSETARKLCYQNNPLPNRIFGEDLLEYWLDTLDNPYQYLFMGMEETMSKLHRDNGGLEISIAPIIGQKECVLVHRSDGAVCFYHLDAKLEDIDLQSYPLMSQARVWKTTISPGEILLMPNGTYHQCRNLTPCLSYSRFHLDTVNIRDFFQSMINDDAKTIKHEEIIWNSTTELMRKIDKYFDEVRKHIKSPATRPYPPLTADTIDLVETLRCLRHICREIARRKAVEETVKGRHSESPAGLKNDTVDGKAKGTSYRQIDSAKSVAHAQQEEKVRYTARDWEMITDDVDMSLHEFRHRRMSKIPAFRPRHFNSNESSRAQRNDSNEKKASVQNRRATADVSIISDSAEEEPCSIIAFGTDLEKAFRSLPKVDDEEHVISSTEDAEFAIEEEVNVQWMGRSIKGKILQIERSMNAALLSYEEYPAVYDEYQPVERLRMPNSVEAGAELSPGDIRPGMVVVNLVGELGDEYRANIRSTSSGTFYNVQFDLRKCLIDRWVMPESITKRTTSPAPSDSLIGSPEQEDVSNGESRAVDGIEAQGQAGDVGRGVVGQLFPGGSPEREDDSNGESRAVDGIEGQGQAADVGSGSAGQLIPGDSLEQENDESRAVDGIERQGLGGDVGSGSVGQLIPGGSLEQEGVSNEESRMAVDGIERQGLGGDVGSGRVGQPYPSYRV